MSNEREPDEADPTEGPGNVTVDEPTETSLDPARYFDSLLDLADPSAAVAAASGA